MVLDGFTAKLFGLFTVFIYEFYFLFNSFFSRLSQEFGYKSIDQTVQSFEEIVNLTSGGIVIKLTLPIGRLKNFTSQTQD
jgi:hypothetical protein